MDELIVSKRDTKEIMASNCYRCNPDEFGDLLGVLMAEGKIKRGDLLRIDCEHCGVVELDLGRLESEFEGK